MQYAIAFIVGGLLGIIVSILVQRIPEKIRMETEKFIALAGGGDTTNEFEVGQVSVSSLSNRFTLSVVCITAFASLGAMWRFGMTEQYAAVTLMVAQLLALSLIDYQKQLLPDDLNYLLMWTGLTVNIGVVFCPLQDAVIGAMVGYLALAGMAWTFKKATGVDGMGNGDFKLLAALGAWVGCDEIVLVLAVSMVAALGFALIRKIYVKSPYTSFGLGPYLALAGIATIAIPH